MANMPHGPLPCVTPQGAFYIMPDVSSLFGRRLPTGEVVDSSDVFCLRLLSFGVSLVPGSAFGAPSTVRISFASARAEVVESMARFSKFVASLSA
jgi:aspartate aminotransferase